MLRIISGVITGFIVWSILWVGLGEILSLILPEWYGKTAADFRAAVAAQTPYALSFGVLIWLLVQSVICSLISGYVAALVARENAKSTLLLGILLLLFGIFVQSMHWNHMPLWYHVPFLLLLIPSAILGGKFRKN
ncbi:MAG TPA: hypothetical protein VK400_01935 [Pyrinomonadaceae bacterium]|nr:hypothetical protein [Pyrinomonadaceae bacterium]